MTNATPFPDIQKRPHIAITVTAIFLGSLVFQGAITWGFFRPFIPTIYQLASQQYLDGQLEPVRLVDFSPLYLYTHIAARKWCTHPDITIIGLQLTMSAGSTVFVFLILRTFFPFALSVAGTIVFITNRSVLVYISAFVPEALMMFFLVGFLYCSLRHSPGGSLLTGVFLSGSLLTRSNLFPLVFVTPIFYWLNRRPHPKCLLRIALFGLPIIITIGGLITRNTVITGQFTPFGMNPGTVFFEGNNPNSYGESSVYPPLVNDLKRDFDQEPDFQHVSYRIFARRITEHPLSIPEVNAYWATKATNFLKDYPLHTLKLYLTKLHSFFHGYRKHDLSSIYWNDQRLQKTFIPTLPFAVVSALAIPGLFLSFADWKRRLLLYTTFGSQFGIMLLTYISARLRVAVVALLIVFAAETIRVGIGNTRLRWLLLLTVVALLPGFWIMTDPMVDDAYTWDRYAASGKFLSEARNDRHTGHLRQAAEKNAFSLALAPAEVDSSRLAEMRFAPQPFQARVLEIAASFKKTSPSMLLDLAVLYLENDRMDKAKAILDQLIHEQYRFNRQQRQSSQPYFYRARIAWRQQQRAEAIAFLEQGLRQTPGDPWALAYLFALTADTSYKDLLWRYFDAIDAEFLLGQAYLDTEQSDLAVDSFAYVVAKLPEYRKGQIYYSLALGAAGDYERAARQYLDALKKGRDPIFRETEVLHIFRMWASQTPQTPETRYYLAVVLREFGHYQEALDIQQELLAAYPNREEIQQNITWLETALENYEMNE